MSLHHATKALGLRFFVLFSSLSGVVGQPGQANYASANTFQDAITSYRLGMGLPESVVDVGAVEDIGVVSRSDGLMEKMKTAGLKTISESEPLNAMAFAMSHHQHPKPADSAAGMQHSAMTQAFVLGLGSNSPLEKADNRPVWRRDRRMAVYHNFNPAGAAASDMQEPL